MLIRGFLLFLLFSITLHVCSQTNENVSFSTSRELVLQLNRRAENLLYENTNESLKLAKQAQKLSQESKDYNEESRADLIVAMSYYLKGKLDSAALNVEKLLEKAQLANNDTLIARGHNLMGAIFNKKNDLLKAEETFRWAIKIFEKINDSVAIAKGYSNLCTILNKQGKYYESLEIEHKSLILFEQFNDSITLAIALTNIAETYMYVDEFKQASKYNLQAIHLIEKSKSANLLISLYANQGRILKYLGEINEAKTFFLKALSLIEDSKNNVEYGYIMHNIAEIEYVLGNIQKAYMNNEIAIRDFLKFEQNEDLLKAYFLKIRLLIALNKVDDAKMYLSKCLKPLITLDMPDLKKDYYLVASEYYTKIENFNKAHGFYKQYATIKDSLYHQQKSKELTNILNQHENLKNQKEIEQQKNQLLQKDLELAQNKTRQRSIISLFILVAVIAFLLLVLYRSIHKKNKLIAGNMDELSHINVKLNKQSMANKDKNKILEKYKKDITDSIQYAERIQNALFPTKATLDKALKDYFILFKPKDIVSGDFYWVRNFQDHMVLIVADCTGHGVPGAFMSLLGITLLKEIVVRNDVKTSDTVLNVLRDNLKEALKQTGEKYDQKDGINLSFVAINYNTNELQFSGAYNGAYVLRNNKIISLKGDVQPVGYYFKEKPFTKQSVTLEENDKIYLFTDGFVDQFNEHNKRYSKQQLRNKLIKINNLALAEQKSILEQDFISWQNTQEQIDDVLVVGFNWKKNSLENIP